MGLLALVAVGDHSSRGAHAESPRRPNFVVIVLDDLSKEMFRRSSLRASAERGLSFANAFAPTPLCCPARSTILTGRYTHSHRVRSNDYRPETGVYGGERQFRERGLETRTVAYLLQQSGYRTSLMGKYLNGYGQNDGGPSGEDVEAPPDEPDERGSHPLRVPPGWTDWRVGANVNGVLVPRGDDHPTDRLKRNATEFVRERAGREEPYFLYLADQIPHRESPPAARYEHAHDGAPLPKSPNYNEKDTSDKPGYIARDEKLPAAGVRPEGCSRGDWPIAYPTEDLGCIDSEDYSRHTWEAGLEGLESITELYDELIVALRQTGQLDNTYILLVSDNGVHIGEHRQGYGKNTPYIEDVEVPLTLRGPGVRANTRLSHLVGLQDIAPTVIDLAGLKLPGEMEGRSLRPLISADPVATSAWRKRMLVEGFPQGAGDRPEHAPGDTPGWRGLLTWNRAKYVEYPSTREKEYYNLRLDPFELVNRMPSLRRTRREQLAREVRRLAQCSGALSCRAAESDSAR